MREVGSPKLLFEKKGWVGRRRVLHESRWTYRLFLLKKPFTIDSIMDCPCMACDEMDRCIPERFTSPVLCPILAEWINLNASEKTRETPHPHFTSIQ